MLCFNVQLYSKTLKMLPFILEIEYLFFSLTILPVILTGMQSLS